jgi:aspartate carbamoyltransferase catalytic subunit
MKHVLSVQQFADKTLLAKLFKSAAKMQALPPAEYPKLLENLTLATIFYEPSTRTRLSFETAVQNLGGKVITVENAGDSASVYKGESLEDTIKVINAYADGIILRHPEIGAAKRAAAVSDVPIINAGDGASEHPTQALLDAYSIQKALGKIDGLKIALVGDLEHSRTHRSLMFLLSCYDVELFLISPKNLVLPDKARQQLKRQGVKFHELTDWSSVIGKLDVMYINRVQKERFKLIEEYNAVKGNFCLTLDAVKEMKKTAVILDPLPRVDEIAPEVDSDPRAQYFQQVKNGLFLRMALLSLIYNS